VEPVRRAARRASSPGDAGSVDADPVDADPVDGEWVERVPVSVVLAVGTVMGSVVASGSERDGADA
jgi:hypothetical protein